MSTSTPSHLPHLVTTEDAIRLFKSARDSLRAAESAYWADPPEKRWGRFNAESEGPTWLFLADSHRGETDSAEYERRRQVVLGYYRQQVALIAEIREQEEALLRLRAEYQIAAVRLAEAVAGDAA